jgi:hypothetical protein
MHQLLAYEDQLTSAMITARFIDGLRYEIKSVVVIHRLTGGTFCSTMGGSVCIELNG